MKHVSLKNLLQEWPKDADAFYVGEKPYLGPDSELPASHARFLEFIRGRKAKEKEGLLGIGNLFFNLDIAAHAKYPWAIFADINPAQVRLANTLIDCLTTEGATTTAKAFYAAFKKKIPGVASPVKLALEDLEDELARPGSWLHEPVLFAHLVTSASCGNLVAVPLDLFDAQQCKKLAGQVRSSARMFGTVNLSNLTGMLKDDEDFSNGKITDRDIRRFWDNVGAFCSRATTVCDACYQNTSSSEVVGRRGHSTLGDYVFAHGSLEDRRKEHLARRKALAQGNARAFWDDFQPLQKRTLVGR